MSLSNRQLKFIEYVKKDNKVDIDVDNPEEVFRVVVLNLFEMYLTAEKESDRKEVVWQINSIKDKYKKNIHLWHLIEDKEEFLRLVKIKAKEIDEQSKNQHKRRHQKRDDFALTHEEWEETKEFFNFECAYCGSKNKLTYDHFHPFSKGGDFMKGNVIPCCGNCNSGKNNKAFEKWYPNQEFYDEQRASKILKYIELNQQLTFL